MITSKSDLRRARIVFGHENLPEAGRIRYWSSLASFTALVLGILLFAPAPARAQDFVLEGIEIVSIDGTNEGDGLTLTGTIATIESTETAAEDFALSGAILPTDPALLTPSVPQLTISPTIGGITITWRLPATGFELEEAASLDSPTPWAPTSLTYTTNATHISVTIASPVGNRFFRLSNP